MPEETLQQFLDELRSFRDDLAERFHGDIGAIVQHIEDRAREQGQHLEKPSLRGDVPASVDRFDYLPESDPAR